MPAQAKQLVDSELQDWYRGLLAQPVPDRLVALVNALDATAPRAKPARKPRRTKTAALEAPTIRPRLATFRSGRALAASPVSP